MARHVFHHVHHVRRRCARGAAARIISTYVRGLPLHSPRGPTAREWAKLADEKVAARKAAKEDFDASLKQLRFKVLGAKGQVEAKARDEAQRAASLSSPTSSLREIGPASGRPRLDGR